MNLPVIQFPARLFAIGLFASLSLVAAGPAFAASCSADAGAPVDVEDLYGERIAFEVRREGRRVGSHETRFERDGDRLTVSSEMQLKVKVLFITAYRFEYQSEEVWCGDAIQTVEANVNDNGDRISLVGRRQDEQMAIDRDDEAGTLIDGDLFPTNHWNEAVLRGDAVLNTITGRVNKVEIVPMGVEEIETTSGTIKATRYEYRGELETEAWYDDRGRWVKLRFAADDGSTIEYVCTTCGASDSGDAS